MKKILPIVLVLIVLAGVGWYLSKKQGNSLVSEKSRETVAPTPGSTGGVISSIKDAMGLGKKMKCTYSAKDGSGAASTVFIDGQKYKFTADANGTTMYGLFDGTTQYTWTTGKEKQGFKMTQACIEELSKAAPQTTAPTSTTPQDLEETFDSAQNVQCEAATSEDFSVPTDITFTDQCEMMKSSLKALEGMKDQLPAGVNIPGY